LNVPTFLNLTPTPKGEKKVVSSFRTGSFVSVSMSWISLLRSKSFESNAITVNTHHPLHDIYAKNQIYVF
jgi:hypothetical protein